MRDPEAAREGTPEEIGENLTGRGFLKVVGAGLAGLLLFGAAGCGGGGDEGQDDGEDGEDD